MQKAFHRYASLSIVLAILAQSSLIAQQQQQQQLAETFPPLDAAAPQTLTELWAGFDPAAEPLETEVLKQWTEDGVAFQVVRLRIGVFKGKVAKLAAVYGAPSNLPADGSKLPGLLQIHGGGQYADYRACLQNAKRGYATLSISWAGRINAPGYSVTPKEVAAFWAGDPEAANYRLTTDWGGVDGYHAPSRNKGNQFPSIKPAAWTLDAVESPRNSGWFLAAVAARRGLTFLSQQPEVDAERLGVYGHSMGGKLTVMTASDPRVKAAAPSCGGISDRYSSSELFRSTLGDDCSLREISCPIVFLSPANDFHGRIGDLPTAISEIQSGEWRVTCSPHHNHQDTPAYEAATLLWFDQYLQNKFRWPKTPTTHLDLKGSDGIPTLQVIPDTSSSHKILRVDVYYTQQGKPNEKPEDRLASMHRFWHHAATTQTPNGYLAKLPLADVERPLWAFANIEYALPEPAVGAGYYYGTYESNSFKVSSLLTVTAPTALQAAKVQPTLKRNQVVEDFEPGWEQEWFTYRPTDWARTTHKINSSVWQASTENDTLDLTVEAAQPNQLVVRIDDYAAVVKLEGGQPETHSLRPQDFRDSADQPLPNWTGIRRLTLSPAETLRNRKERSQTRRVGGTWQGPAPKFRLLRWSAASADEPAPDGEAAEDVGPDQPAPSNKK